LDVFHNSVRAIFAVARAGGDRWTRDQLVVLAFRFSKRSTDGRGRTGTSCDSEARPHFVRHCLRGVRVDLRLLPCGIKLSWTALAGAALVMVLARRDTHEVLKLVDWHLLAFFAALFVVVDGLSDTGLPDAIYRHLQPMFGLQVTTQA
jgi:di/tricarboxylate transporter